MEHIGVAIYTWQDVERTLYTYRNLWPEEWKDIEVFSTELCIYVDNTDGAVWSKTNQFLKNLFKHYYVDEQIRISVTETVIDVVLNEYDDMTNAQPRQPFPLFKDFLYVSEENDIQLERLKGVPVLAFHSYKGGVGRTLSLITFVRNMIDADGGEKKVLIVDGDMEAPGLTWLAEQQNGRYDISYIDVLNIINAKGVDDRIFDG